MVPHELPTAASLSTMIRHLPLRLDSFTDAGNGDELYLAVMTRARAALLPSFALVRGVVGRGFGRGGKKLGVPTANLKPEGDGPLREGELPVREAVCPSH